MTSCPYADSLVVIDFETTGLSPELGDRPIEIGAVRLDGGDVISKFQCLMNPGVRISPFIEQYTGITNSMLRDAPPISAVMRSYVDFAGDSNVVAHNASFDRRFLVSELHRLGRKHRGDFACSMLVARRVYQHSAKHTLSTLAELNQLRPIGSFHRALSDAHLAAQLWVRMIRDLNETHNIGRIPFSLMQAISRRPRKTIHRFIQKWAATNASANVSEI